MSMLFLMNQGSEIKRISRRIVIKKDNLGLLEIPIRKTDSITIFGNVSVSPQAFSLIASAGVPLTYLYTDGKIKGQFLPARDKNMSLRFLQYNCSKDPIFTNNLVKFILVEKINSIIEFYKKNRIKNAFTDQYYINDVFEEIKEKIIKAKTYEELLGYEGYASKIHFNIYGALFKGAIQFNGRNRRPPKDEANALLSFGYNLLFNLINGICYSSGLDNYVGFLHKQYYNRASLALDIMEPFRTKYIDKMVLTLCNLNHFTEKDFDKNEVKTYLNGDGIRKLSIKWTELLKENENKVHHEIKDLVQKVINTIKKSDSKEN